MCKIDEPACFHAGDGLVHICFQYGYILCGVTCPASVILVIDAVLSEDQIFQRVSLKEVHQLLKKSRIILDFKAKVNVYPSAVFLLQ